MTWKKQKDRELIAQFLPSIVKEKGWEKQLDLHSIFPYWRELASPDAAEHSKPLKIRKGVLWLEVENSAWMQQLQYEKVELLERLNEFLSLGRLSDIKMVLAEKNGGDLYGDADDEESKIQFRRPPEEEIARFEKLVGCIEDKECRDALMQFWYLANACKRNDK